MELVRGAHNLAPRHHGCVATIGNFDGVHRGHQAVLAELRGAAEARGVPSVLVTFEPHPREYFAPASAPPRLTSLRDKLAAVGRCGIDRLVVLRFGAGLARLEPEAFIDDFLVARLGVRFLMVGDDFRFGRERRGDFALLRAAGERHGFRVTNMPTVQVAGERVSSTRIRALLAEDRLADAAELLGRPYTVTGRVVHGDHLGRSLGWPTVNLRFSRQRPPVAGIYTVTVKGAADRSWPGVASVGTRPTVNGQDLRLEVHLLDFEGDLYGAHLRVEFLEKLRSEERFESLAVLRERIGDDVAEARRRFAAAK